MKVGWKTVMKQQKLVEKMTIEEKAAILSGKLSGRPEKLTGFPSRPSFFQMDRMELESRQGQETIWD